MKMETIIGEVVTTLRDLGKNLDNWASVDHYTVSIFGVLWGKGVVGPSRPKVA